MTGHSAQRGAVPVGYVCELGPVETGAILYLRLWFDGPDAQSQVWQDFSSSLGQQRGRQVIESFEVLCDLCVRYARRPMMRHHVTCKCVGADESCFANFVGYASEGAREDALLMAVNMVRPDVAVSLVDLAAAFGLALKCMAGRLSDDSGRAMPTTIH